MMMTLAHGELLSTREHRSSPELEELFSNELRRVLNSETEYRRMYNNVTQRRKLLEKRQRYTPPMRRGQTAVAR